MTRKRRARLSHIALALLASTAAIGCGLTLAFGPAVVNRCTGPSECGGGECVDNACITTAVDPAMSVVLEVVAAPDPLVPPRASHAFAPVEVLGPTVLDLTLPEETIVAGSARFGDGDDAMRVPVEVTFTPVPGFGGSPGASVRVTSDLVDYAVLLEDGRAYDVVVAPTGAPVPELESSDFPVEGGPPATQIFPPLYFDALDPSEIADGALDFTYSDGLFEPCDAEVHDGCTLGGSVLSVDAVGTTLAEPGLLVRAVEGSGRVVSSAVSTDDEGKFAIRIMPDAGPYVLRVTAPESVALPNVDVEVDFDLDSAERTIRLPRFAPVTLENYVAYSLDGVLHPVDHAAVAFESVEVETLDLPGAFSFRRTAFTEIPTIGPSPFTLAVMPGTYRVVVVPADADRAGVLVDESVVIDPRSAGTVIAGGEYSLPVRARLLGGVFTPGGDPIPLAGLRARRVPAPSSLSAGDVQRFGRSSEAVADAYGEFSLPLDVGTFDLVVRAGEGTGYAWHVVSDVVVADHQGDTPMDVSIAPPIPASGVVRAADGAPLASALVRAYVLLGSGDALRAVPVGEATTASDGSYELLLPGGI